MRAPAGSGASGMSGWKRGQDKKNDEVKQDAHVCVTFDVADEGEVAGTGVADVCVDGDGAARVSRDVIRKLRVGGGGGIRPELATECAEGGHGEDGRARAGQAEK